MISALLGIIGRTPWVIQALLYACLGLLVTSIGLGVTVKIQSARLDAAAARAESLGDKIASQNRSVAAWKAEADKQVEKANAAAQRAEKVRTVTVERVRTITAAPIPSTCTEAVKWGTEHALEFNQRWEEGEGDE